MLTCFLPGWLLLQVIGFTAEDRLEQITLASAVSYALTVLVALVVLYVTGQLSALSMVTALSLGSLLLVVVGLLRPTSSVVNSPRLSFHLAYFLIPAFVAAFFSFTNLGYSDYWGDEMNGLLRAIAAIAGRHEAIFEHTKGPAEVLLPAVFGLLVGRFEPFTLRCPFALAQVVGAGGFYLLGQRLFGRNVGLFAALALIVNGLYLAFGRIVQYQVLVFLMTSLSMLMAYRFYRSGQGVYLVLGSLLIGVGLLAHYDMLVVLPPIGYLVCLQWATGRSIRLQLMGALIALLAVIAFFYIPFLLHPHLAETSSYLSRIVGISSWPASNFDELYVFAVMYNSVLYVAFIALLGTGTITVDLVSLFYEKRRDKRLWLVVIITLILCVVAIVAAQSLLVPLFFSITLLGLLIGFSTLAIERRLVYVWVGASFIGYVFFIDHPRTHLQVIYPGWSLLAALALERLILALRSRFRVLRDYRAVAGVIIVLCLLFSVFAGYEYLLFLDVQREYVFTYPEHKSPLYWEDANFPFGSRRLYGAPHRLGWQMINLLYLQGDLQGDWDSNDEGSNLFWYTLGFPRNPCYPKYYFEAGFQQKEETENNVPAFSLADYIEIGEVWNRDRLQIKVYEFVPTGRDDEVAIWREPERYTSWVMPDRFHSFQYEMADPSISITLSTPAVFRPSPGALEQIAKHYGDSRIMNVRDTVTLIGYDLDDTWAKRGGPIVLTLYWQSVEVVNLPYKIFVHLEGNGGMGGSPTLWAQSDDFPACGSNSTQHWQVGQKVIDRHVVELPDTIPPGDYVLRVGLYEPQTGLRMDLLDSLFNPQGTSLELTHFTIQPSAKQGNGSNESLYSHSTP